MTASLLRPLKTDRLVLLPVRRARERWLQRVMERPEVNRNTLVIPTPCPKGFARGWIDSAAAQFESGKAYTYVITLGTPARAVGCVFLLVNQAHAHAELGYFIDLAHWSKGYATEASGALLEFGFDRVGLHRIFATHFGGNPASGKVMKKIGMKHEGCRREHILKNGAFIDIEQYGILKGERRP